MNLEIELKKLIEDYFDFEVKEIEKNPQSTVGNVYIVCSNSNKYVIKIYNRFFEVIDSIIEFIFRPFYLFKQIIIFIFKKIHKICKICCKKFLYMLILIKRGIRSINLKKFNNIKNKKNKKNKKKAKDKKSKES